MTDDVFDLDALAAEADSTPFRFKFGGEEFEIPPMDITWAAIDGSQLSHVDMFKLLVGDEQWARITASKARLTEPLFVALLDKWMAHYGVTLGESRASRRSSKSTARPSKQTSSGTTTVR